MNSPVNVAWPSQETLAHAITIAQDFPIKLDHFYFKVNIWVMGHHLSLKSSLSLSLTPYIPYINIYALELQGFQTNYVSRAYHSTAVVLANHTAKFKKPLQWFPSLLAARISHGHGLCWL